MEEPSEYIDFMVKYRDWISIRRLSFDSNTKPEELAYILADIKSTIENKYYSFLRINISKLDDYAAKLASSAGKGYSAAGKALEQIDGKEAKGEILEACADPKLKKIAEAYLAGRLIAKLGIKTGIDNEEMLKLYPELKIYKRRMPKGAKAGAAEA